MAVETTQSLRCDRCETSSTGEWDDWGRVAAQRRTGEPVIGARGGEQHHDDLCPRCLSGLQSWYASDEAPPLIHCPPASPPPRMRPALTIEDRGTLEILLTSFVSSQIGRMVEAIAEEPTSILNGPGVLASHFSGQIGDDVAGFVDSIVQRFELATPRPWIDA